MEINVLQLHKKDVEVFAKIEDKVSINTANGSLAVCDGATQGFCSGIWADVVTREFTEMPVFNIDVFCNSTLKRSASKYIEQIDRLPANESKVFARLIEDKKKEGGYSTFIGVQFLKDQQVKILCVGDSNLFYLSGQSIQGVPSGSLEELNESGNFINSQHIIEDKLDSSIIKSFQTNVSPGVELLIATDAISRYLFKNAGHFEKIKSIDTFEKLLAFAEEGWSVGTLEQDDLTIVRIRVNTDTVMSVGYIVPPNGFRFGAVKPSLQSIQPGPLTSLAPNNDRIVSDLRAELALSKKSLGEEINTLSKELKRLSFHYNSQANRAKSFLILCGILLASTFVFIYMYAGANKNLTIAMEKNRQDSISMSTELNSWINRAKDKRSQQGAGSGNKNATATASTQGVQAAGSVSTQGVHTTSTASTRRGRVTAIVSTQSDHANGAASKNAGQTNGVGSTHTGQMSVAASTPSAQGTNAVSTHSGQATGTATTQANQSTNGVTTSKQVDQKKVATDTTKKDGQKKEEPKKEGPKP